ncbi:MAG: MFS transporter, partial [Acidobacteriota bacterium]|nr:MFS transporter [Acidobacteriota bacterium]
VATSDMGFVRSFAGLLFFRAALGVGQSGAVPAFGKLNGMYLEPKERAFGAALQQTGLSIGGMLAPPFAVWIALRYSWRAAFIAAGVAGLLWIPIWLLTTRRIPPAFETGAPRIPIGGMLRDRRLQALVLGNVLWMGTYTLWSNWTTLYLVQVHHQSVLQAAWYAWIPPLMANAGAFLGGWLSLHSIRGGLAPAQARLRAILISAAGSLLTAAIPLTPNAGWATAGISLSYFWAASGSVNIYTLPLDLYGAERAGFAISALVFAYGMLQTFFSPAIGYLVDRHGYGPVCLLVAVLPMLAYAVIARFKPGTAATSLPDR